MSVKIVLRQDGVYDLFDEPSGRWVFSTTSADNVLLWLSRMPIDRISYTTDANDEQNKNYCTVTGLACSFCQPGSCEYRVH